MPHSAPCRVCFQCGSKDLDQQACGCYFFHRCNRCGREEEGQVNGDVKIIAGAGVLRCKPIAGYNCPTHIISLRAGSGAAQVEELIRRLQLDARIARIVQTKCIGGHWIEQIVFDRVPPPPPATRQGSLVPGWEVVAAYGSAYQTKSPAQISIAA